MRSTVAVGAGIAPRPYRDRFSGGVGRINDHDTSVSHAGISGFGGQDSARTGDASTSLKNDFDASKAQAKLAAQVSITQTLSKEAPQAVANFAKARMDQAAEQYKAAAEETDPQVREQKRNDALDDMAAWDEGGRYRVAMHVAMGAAGAGWQGALGAGVSASAAPTLGKLQNSLRDELTPVLGQTAALFVSQGLIQLTTGAAGATLGGVQGAQWATAVDVNNRQLHPLEAYRIRQKAAVFADKYGISPELAEARLGQQVLRNIDTNHEKRMGPDDAQAQAFLKENGLGKETVDPITGERFQLFTADAATRQNHAMFGQYAKRDATTRDELDRAYDPAFKPAGSPTTQGISGSYAGALSGSDIALGDAANDLSHMPKQSPEVQRQVFSELRAQRQEIKQIKEAIERELKEMNARGDRGKQAAERRTEITLELARLDHEDQYLRKASVEQLKAMGSAGVVRPAFYREWSEGFAEGFGVAGLRLNGAVSGRSGVLREPNPARPNGAAASGEAGAGKVEQAEVGAGSKRGGEGAAADSVGPRMPEQALGSSPAAGKAAGAGSKGKIGDDAAGVIPRLGEGVEGSLAPSVLPSSGSRIRTAGEAGAGVGRNLVAEEAPALKRTTVSNSVGGADEVVVPNTMAIPALSRAAQAEVGVANKIGNTELGRFGVLKSPNELMGVEPASAELLTAVGTKRSLVIATPGSEELRMLDYFGAEASVGGVNNSSILLRENPSKAAVLEEFLHGTQARLGIVDRLGTSGLGSAETHVKDFMIRHQQMLGLSNEDVRILKILRDKGL